MIVCNFGVELICVLVSGELVLVWELLIIGDNFIELVVYLFVILWVVELV